MRRHRHSTLSRLRRISTRAVRVRPHCSNFVQDWSTEAAANRAPVLPAGPPFQTAPAIGRTSSMLHPRRLAWIRGFRTRREAACRRCAGRSGRRVRNGHRRPHGRHRPAFWSRASCRHRGLRHGPTHRGFRATLRDRNHPDLAMRPGSMRMWTGEQVRRPTEELCACISP